MPRDLFQEQSTLPPLARASEKTSLNEGRSSSAPRDLFEAMGRASPESQTGTSPSASSPTLAGGKDVLRPGPGANPDKTGMRPTDKSSVSGDWTQGVQDLMEMNEAGSLGMRELVRPLMRYNPLAWFVGGEAEINKKINALSEQNIQELARRRALPDQPVNPTYERWQQSESETFSQGLGNAKQALTDDPVGFLRSLVVRNAPISLPGMAGGIAGSIGGAPGALAGGALGSYPIEFGSRIIDELERRGVDIENADAIKAAMAKDGDTILKEAAKDATIVSFIEGAGSAISGKIATSALGPVSKFLGGTATESLAGAGGEAATQVRQSGGVSNWNAVFGEALGEAAGGGIQTFAQEGVHRLKGASAKFISKPSQVLSEEELKKLWEESNPEQPISTYTEAVNSGRKNFAFVENDSTGPAELTDYDTAEAKAGRGDFRRGKLIAVDDSQIQYISTLQNTDILASDAIANAALKKPGISQIFQQTIQSMNSVKSMEFTQIYMNAHAAGKKILDAGGSNADAIQAAKNVFDNAKEFKQRVFIGDANQFRITPRTDNKLYYTQLLERDNLLRVVKSFSAGRMADAYYATDLDELQTKATENGWQVVPSSNRQYYTKPQTQTLIQQTFDFATPETMADFAVADEKQMAYLFASGQVKWKGRIDPRFLSPIAFSSGFQVIDSAGKNVSLDKIRSVVKEESVPFTQQGLPGQFWNSSDKNRKVSKEIDHLWNMLANKSGVTGPVQSIGKSPLHAQMHQLLSKWYKDFGGTKNVLFITQTEFQKVPRIVESLGLTDLQKELNNTGFLGFYWGISPNTHMLVVKDQERQLGAGDNQTLNTLAHEFGHLMSAERLMSLPLEKLLALHSAWRRMYAGTNYRGGEESAKVIQARNQASRVGYPIKVYDDYEYNMQFEEWIAEQMSKYMTSRADTLGTIAKFLRSTAKEIIAFMKREDVKQYFGITSQKAEPEFEDFMLASRTIKVQYEPAIAARIAELSANVNKPYGNELPQSELSGPYRQIISKHLGPLSSNRQTAKIIASEMDKYNWFYKWAANLRQLAESNPHIQQLQLIREFLAFAKNDTSKIMVGAEETLIKWRQLGFERGNNLTQFMFALDAMEYLSPAEKARNVKRWPNPQEFIALAKQYKMDNEMQVVYREVRNFFLTSLKRQEELQLLDANRITDPVMKAAAIKLAQDTSRKLLQKPYFPQTRFGKWALTVRDANNKIEHFELFETKGELRRAGDTAGRNFPNSKINLSTVPEESMPFVGVPTWMLDQIATMPGLSQSQLEWIEQFRYMIAPSQSFRKHMMKRKNYSGYSEDGMRVFANYTFHHARFYSRIKYDTDIRTAIDSLRRSAGDVDSPSFITPRVQIADFLERVYREWRNPGQDWAKLRQLTAIWHLGFVPKSAIVNMTQVPLATVPFLSSKFGGVKGEAAILNAARKLSTYYKKGNIKGLGTDESRAIMQAVDDGYIDESMAAELAALAMGGGMGNQVGKAMAGDKFQRGYVAFTEKAMWMFRMAEQWNRRVTFRAAYQLALENPSASYVTGLRNKYILKHAELTKAGWTDSQILAYLAGVDAIESTQYTYDREARPRYMQGRKSAFFAFQLFTQQTLWMLWNNKDMFARYILYSMLLGGAMGTVPDDAEELTKGIAYWLFGKDFDLEREVRKYVNDIVGGETADLLLHGTARYGFGIPKLAHMLGADFVPTVDLSGSATLNQILPISTRGLATPGASWQDVISQQVQNTAGATFGIPLGMMRAISATDLEIDDFKRWEGAMPAAFRNVTVAMRRSAEGGERTRNYEQTLAYDGEDPEQAAELIAKAMGFRSLREAQASELVRAEREIQAFWQTRKELLLRAAYRARFVRKDTDEYKEIIEEVKKFNQTAPDPKLKITADSLKESFSRRLKTKAKIESGTGLAPPGVRNEVDQIYPGVREVSRKRVK